VLAVCGDGGFMMNAQELETAVRLRLDLVVLVHRFLETDHMRRIPFS
jgi:acetolactate synthase-1/2/3 large subunit